MGHGLFIQKYTPQGGTPADSIEHNGITWNFASTQQTGRYLDGSPWVLNPGGGVQVLNKSPMQTGSGATLRHGDQINPVIRAEHGYDGRGADYLASLTPNYPITLATGESLVSVESRPDAMPPEDDLLGVEIDGRTYLRRAEVLTCVDQIPPADAFRPPFCGSEKPVYRESDVNLGVLPNPPLVMEPGSTWRLPVEGTTFPEKALRFYSRPHILHGLGSNGSNIHPLQNHSNYYREDHAAGSQIAIIALCDYSDRNLALRGVVQHGIDQYFMFKSVNFLYTHRVDRCITRFAPQMAGALLGDNAMRDNADVKSLWGVSFIMQDACTYRSATPLWHGFHSGYRVHVTDDQTDPASVQHEHLNPETDSWCLPWDNMYRHFAGYQTNYRGWTWVGQMLALHLMGLRTAYGHAPAFGYARRWMLEDPLTTNPTWAWIDNHCQNNPCEDGWSGSISYYPRGTPTEDYWMTKMWDKYFVSEEWPDGT